LAKTLQNLSGTVISAVDFDSSKLPSAMRMTYRVVDEHGKQLGLSDDLSALKTQLRDKGRGAVAKAVQVESTIERTGITTWDFDAIPDLLESEVAGNLIRGFPSLVATPKGCDLKLFPTQSERERNHIWGVIALIQAAIPTPAKYIAQHLSQQEKLSLVSLGYKDTEHFVRDLIAAMSEQEIRKLTPSGVLLHRAEFEKVRDAVAAAAIEKAFEVAGVLVRIASAAAEATKAISAVKTIDLLPILSFEKDHMAQLLTANLVSTSGLDRLARLPIYLKAIAVRITKLAENPAKDVAPAAELAAALRVYAAAGGQLPLPRDASSQQQAGRWLLEEFRVSLFAQSLGTSSPVSLQRIEKALSK
jgi:ATP-dependent helicase HrpA